MKIVTEGIQATQRMKGEDTQEGGKYTEGQDCHCTVEVEDEEEEKAPHLIWPSGG